jgi:transketolase
VDSHVRATADGPAPNWSDTGWSDTDWSDTDRRAVDLIRVLAMDAVEAGIGLGWRGYVGDAGVSVSLEHFGESADYRKLYAEFGITAERVAQAAMTSIERAGRQA